MLSFRGLGGASLARRTEELGPPLPRAQLRGQLIPALTMEAIAWNRIGLTVARAAKRTPRFETGSTLLGAR